MKKIELVIAAFALSAIMFCAFQTVELMLAKSQMQELNEDLSKVEQERKCLLEQLERQEETEKPTVAVVAEVLETPVFEPLDIPLDVKYQEHAWTICQREDIPYPIFAALMWGESRHIPDVADNVNVDGTRDRGLCQINEVNWEWLAKDYGLDVNDPYDNIEAGVIILAMFWHKYTPEQALTAYAWGEAGMLEAGIIAPTAERVLERASLYESDL